MTTRKERNEARIAQEAAALAQRSANIINTPDNWPRYPVLPLTRINAEKQELGLLVTDGTGYRVTFCNLFDNPAVKLAAPFNHYADEQAVVADGWRVD